MSTIARTIPRMAISASPARRRTGLAVATLAVLFLLLDGIMKVLSVAPVVESFGQLGYPGGIARTIGILLLTCLALYVTPRTSVLGAILLTGYLGGAVATHVRIGNPLFSHILFPVYLGLLLWGGLYLRDERLRALIPLRDRPSD